MAILLNKPQDNTTTEAAANKVQELSKATPAYVGIGNPGQSNQSTSAPKFTNIQSYLNANKGAGEQLANTVGNKIGGEITQQSQNVASKVSDVSSTSDAIKAGEQKQKDLINNFGNTTPIDWQAQHQYTTDPTTGQPAIDPNTGKPYEAVKIPAPTPSAPSIPADASTMSGDGLEKGTNTISRTDLLNNTQPVAPVAPAPPKAFTPEDMNDDQLKEAIGYLNQITQGKQGDQLKTQTQSVADTAAIAKQAALDRLNQFNSSAGRANLLQDTIAKGKAGYAYGGLGSLDQALMQTAGQGKFIDTQKQALSGQQQSLLNQIKDSDTMSTAAKDELTKSLGLGSDLKSAVQKSNDDMMTNLQARIPLLQQVRGEDKQRIQDTMLYLSSNGAQGKYDPAAAQILQLGAGTNVFNVFKDTGTGAFVNYGRDVSGIQDVASQADVNRYKAIQNLLQGKVDDTGVLQKASDANLQIKAPSNLDQTASLAMVKDNPSQSVLSQTLGNTYQDFLKDYLGKSFTGSDSQTGGADYNRTTYNESATISPGKAMLQNLQAQQSGLQSQIDSETKNPSNSPGYLDKLRQQLSDTMGQMDYINNIINPGSSSVGSNPNINVNNLPQSGIDTSSHTTGMDYVRVNPDEGEVQVGAGLPKSDLRRIHNSMISNFNANPFNAPLVSAVANIPIVHDALSQITDTGSAQSDASRIAQNRAIAELQSYLSTKGLENVFDPSKGIRVKTAADDYGLPGSSGSGIGGKTGVTTDANGHQWMGGKDITAIGASNIQAQIDKAAADKKAEDYKRAMSAIANMKV